MLASAMQPDGADGIERVVLAVCTQLGAARSWLSSGVTLAQHVTVPATLGLGGKRSVLCLVRTRRLATGRTRELVFDLASIAEGRIWPEPVLEVQTGSFARSTPLRVDAAWPMVQPGDVLALEVVA